MATDKPLLTMTSPIVFMELSRRWHEANSRSSDSRRMRRGSQGSYRPTSVLPDYACLTSASLNPSDRSWEGRKATQGPKAVVRNASQRRLSVVALCDCRLQIRAG